MTTSWTAGLTAASMGAGVGRDVIGASGSAGGVRARQFPAWLDRVSAVDLVADAARRWPWTVVHGGAGPAGPYLVHGDPEVAAAVGARVGDPVFDADMYARVWHLWVSHRWPVGELADLAAVLARTGRRPGALIVELDADTTGAVLAGGWIRSGMARQLLARLDSGGMLGRLRPAAGGGLGCYALTMPTPPLTAVPLSTPRSDPVSDPVSDPQGGAVCGAVGGGLGVVGDVAQFRAGARVWERLSPAQRAAFTSDVVARYVGGMAMRKISARTGLPFRRVHTILVESGTPLRPSGRQPAARVDVEAAEVVALYADSVSIRMVAAKAGIPYHAARRLLKEAGVTLRSRGGQPRSRTAATAGPTEAITEAITGHAGKTTNESTDESTDEGSGKEFIGEDST
ncbi:hypothetical protein ABZS66_12135 [Dactylosporangium sp. NPDC005572]|uniref:helix-turn-helix domain-containing protein n=1 Tax=Dactylosporangium sp. NPDC005572 TaxID=3156889 RepID=UPI0033AD9E37